MNVTVNGGDREVAAGSTVADVVRQTSSAARGIAVALNGEVVPRADWSRRLSEADRVEILVASQGG
ncbi:sulfur carrier protein ThiS [Phytomonospora sp. NPDC050363]|uniref:sulfur carrier protein ThiS n=1 Tax=Phytomonospora sp. NPDC050363 TaxID=3155642 RepID=UPI0033CB0C73